MLSFFTNPYPDELLYSAIARYHFYSGNLDCKDTLEEVFQSRTVIPSVEIGSHFNELTKQMGIHYSVESLLSKYTIYPFYASFLSQEKQQQIMQDVQGDGKGLYARLGMVAGSICRKDGLYYCPQCVRNDMDHFGEPYIHREHQLQGIDICPHHFSSLKKYPVDHRTQSRIAYIRFDVKRMNLSVLQSVEQPYFDIQVSLAKMAYKLLKMDITKFSRESIVAKYRMLLRERGLITTANRIRQLDLRKAFLSKLPIGFLEKYKSTLNVDDEYNWLKVLTRNVKRHVHPFRHLLLLYFLEQDIEQFFEGVSEDIGPFGEGPWPCLNKAASHYKQHVIQEVIVTRDFKSKVPIGTFNCSCGFIYARKGPDKLVDDLYRIGRIKAFGGVWKEKLKEINGEKRYSLREMGRMLGVDPKTIKKYLDSDMNMPNAVMNDSLLKLKLYRERLLQGIRNHPSYSRTQIRKHLPNEYMYLYRQDKWWLFEQLPAIQIRRNSRSTVEWKIRDQEYLFKMKELYKELIALDKPVRITTSLIGKRLGILSNLEKHLGKLPQTTKYLEEIFESTEQFQIRRCCKIIDHMLQEEQPVLLWKIQRLGAVKSHHFHNIKPYLEEYLQNKQEVNNYEPTTG
ncbi:TnsD family transposase [Bacillus cereus group sp. BfR-BA-01346]|uniref:TnsD family transposase n=1 Tax=Bacillus cereus group sp. BfR-BA-01346 TaxID=2920309 RepID=UPI001F59FD6D|nr:TnsD family transposase [Bacillus cereus group sp. BfR-BA-01346]